MALSFEQFQQYRSQGLSPEQIVHAEAMQPKGQPQQPAKESGGFIQGVASDLAKRGQNIKSDFMADMKSAQKPSLKGAVGAAFGKTGVNFLGQVAGGVFDVAGQAIKTGYEKLVPEQTKEDIKNTTLDVLQTPAGQAGLSALKAGTDVWDKFKEANPDTAKYLGNVVNIASVLPVSAPVGEGLTATGKVIEASGEKATSILKSKLAQDIVKAAETKAVKLDQVGRTTEIGRGLLKKSIIEPTKLEKMAADEVAKIPEITAKNTMQQNYNIIKKYAIDEAKNLESAVKSNPFIISKKEIMSRLNGAAKDLSGSPLIVGDAEKMANRLVEGAKKIVSEEAGNGSGLLSARKRFDQWVLSQKPKAFDAKAENAFTMANKAVRDTLNTVLDEKATSVGVKNSLRKQSSLYRAMENVAPKAATEADSAIGRILQRAGDILGTKNRVVQAVAAAAGIGGLGAAATFAPAAAVLGGTGFVLYRGGKFILKPEVRTAIGKLLQDAGHLLNPADVKVLNGIMEKTKGTGVGLTIKEDLRFPNKSPLIQEARGLELGKHKSFIEQAKRLETGQTKNLEGEFAIDALDKRLDSLGIDYAKLNTAEKLDAFHRFETKGLPIPKELKRISQPLQEGGKIATKIAEVKKSIKPDEINTLKDFTDLVAGNLPGAKYKFQDSLFRDVQAIFKRYGLKQVETREGMAGRIGTFLTKLGVK